LYAKGAKYCLDFTITERPLHALRSQSLPLKIYFIVGLKSQAELSGGHVPNIDNWTLPHPRVWGNIIVIAPI
jgi:hypothetical protein